MKAQERIFSLTIMLLTGRFAPCVAHAQDMVASPVPSAQSISRVNTAAKETKMPNESTYPVEYAGPARRCSVGARFKGAGKVTWSRPLNKVGGKSNNYGAENAATGLILWNDRPVVNKVFTTQVFMPDGAGLWERARQPGSPIAAGSDLLYLENKSGHLDAVNLLNEPVLDNVPFPDEEGLRLMWPMKELMLVVSFYSGQEPGPGEPGHGPAIRWSKIMYGKRICEQGGDISKRLRLPPLYVPEKDRLYLYAGDAIESVGATPQKSLSPSPAPTDEEYYEWNEAAHFAASPLEEPVDWHADAGGALFIIGYNGARKILSALSPAGTETWRWEDMEVSDKWVAGQPPIQGGEGRLYALTEKRVLAFKNGKVAWQYETRDAPLKRGTSLADGSILVTAGKKLLRVGADGKVKFAVDMDGEILTSPVVDAAGHIYVATKTHLMRIE